MLADEAADEADVVGVLDAPLGLDVDFDASPGLAASLAGLAELLMGDALDAGGSIFAAMAELAAGADLGGGRDVDDADVPLVDGDVVADAALSASALPFFGGVFLGAAGPEAAPGRLP